MDKAYEGSGSYIFISYSHEDKASALEIIETMQKYCSVWYDEGIHYGEDYISFLANKVKNASFVIYLISNASLNSEYCKNEIHYAFENKIPFIGIELEPNILFSDDFNLMYGRFQRLQIYKYSSVEEGCLALFQGSEALYSLVSKSKLEAIKPLHGKPKTELQKSQSSCEKKKERTHDSPALDELRAKIKETCTQLMEEVKGLKGYTTKDLTMTFALIDALVANINKLPMEELGKISIYVSAFKSLKGTISLLLAYGKSMELAVKMQLENAIFAWCPAVTAAVCG